MAVRRADGAWLLSGRVLPMPVEIRQARVAIAVFTCSASGATAAVADDRLRVVRLGNRSLAAFVCVSYLDGDLDSYDEVGFGVVVRPTAPRRGAAGLYTFELPVTAEFTREAGAEIWGLPKWIADTTMNFAATGLSLTVAEHGELAMSGTIPAGRVRMPFPVRASAVGWSLRTDAVLATRSTTRLADVRLGRAAAITTGPHRMGKVIDSLELGSRPLVTVGASMRATINDVEVVG